MTVIVRGVDVGREDRSAVVVYDGDGVHVMGDGLLDAVMRAWMLRRLLETEPGVTGAAQNMARAEIAAVPSDVVRRSISVRSVDPVAVVSRLMAVTIEDMPPAIDDLAMLLDIAAFRRGIVSRAEVWRRCGIKPARGKDLLARNASAIDWPIWYTVRQFALF